jgi:hypothetical protein
MLPPRFSTAPTFSKNQLAKPAFVGSHLQREGAEILDLERNLAREAGVDRRGRDVGSQTQAGLLAPPLDPGREPTPQGQRYVLQGPD